MYKTSKIRLHQIKMWVLIIKKWEGGIKIKTSQRRVENLHLPTQLKGMYFTNI